MEKIAKVLMKADYFKKYINQENSHWRKTEKLLQYVSDSQKCYTKFHRQLEEKGYKEVMETVGTGCEEMSVQPMSELVAKFESNLKKRCQSKSVKGNQKLNEATGFCDQVRDIHYVELSIANTELLDKGNKENYVLRTAERFDKWDTVTLDEVFKPPKDSFVSPRTAILIGGPGMGKTTITQERAHKWGTEGKIQSQHGYPTKFLFRFQCREYKADKVSVMDLLFSGLKENYDDTQKNEILTAINNRFTEIIFDGLDEIEENTESCRVFENPREKISLSNLVYNLREGNLLENVRFLGTSRPCRDINLRDYNTVVVALGFSQDSIGKCMKAICGIDEGEDNIEGRNIEDMNGEKDEDSDENKHKIYRSIMSHIEESKLYVHCFIPLTCVLLGVILRNELRNDISTDMYGICDRLTNLYIKTTNCFMRRGSNTIKESLRRLCKLAAYGMLKPERKIIFGDNDLSTCGIEYEDTTGGILEYTKNEEQNKKNVASFLHLSYQEFLTAVDVVLNWKEKDIKDIIRQMPKGKYDVVLFFVAGLLSNKEDTTGFLRGLNTDLQETEIESRARNMLSWMKQVQNEYRNRSRKICQLKIMMCLYEGHMEEETREMGWGRTLDLSYIQLLPHQLVSTTYYMERKIGTAELNVLK